MVFRNLIVRSLSTIKFTKSHEYIKPGKEHYTLGITNYAAKELGDIVNLNNVVEKGEMIESEQVISEIDSIKAVSEINTPISGEVIEINNIVERDPSIINKFPLEDGWLLKIKSTDDINHLMEEDDYNKYIESL